MSEDQGQFIPPLDAVYESLAESIEGWASRLGIESTYTDPVLEECGTHDWADSLRRACDWEMRTAISLLSARGQFDHADNLKRRMEELFTAAEAYEQRLDAMEDQRRVHTEGIEARYRELYDDDPDAQRVWQLCRGIHRVWTVQLDDAAPQTPEEFAEAMDRATFEEHGAKLKARAAVKQLAMELAEHLRLVAQCAADAAQTIAAAQPPEPPKPKRGKRGPARIPLAEAWRYLSIVQEWRDISEGNRKHLVRDRIQKVQLAEQHGISLRELDAMLGWYAKHRREKRFPEDPRTVSRGELEKWFV